MHNPSKVNSDPQRRERAAQQKPMRWICLGLVLLVVLVYGRVAWHEWVYFDDNAYVFENPVVSAGISWESVVWAFKYSPSHAGHWHPLTWLSLMLDAHIFDLNAGGFHVTNLLFHVANVLLLLIVLRKMTGALWPSALVAALFAVHPLHVESVAWVTCRKDVLSTTFWILVMFAYTGYARRGGLWRYLLAALLLALGLMAKPMLVTLPFVLLLLDFWPLGRLDLGQNLPNARCTHLRPVSVGFVILEKLPLLALSAASCLISLLGQQVGNAIRPLDAVPVSARCINALVAYATYLQNMVWPANLGCFYPHPVVVTPEVPDSFIAAAKVSGLLLLIITCLAVYLIRRRPYLAVGWFWYLGTLVPVIGLVTVGMSAMADRFTYVTLLGVYMMIAWGATDLVRRWPFSRFIVVGTSAIVLGVLATTTWFQVGTWRNSYVLFDRAIRVTEDNFVIHNFRGGVYAREGKYDLALTDYSASIEQQPEFAESYSYRGWAYDKLGQYNLALQDYNRAIELNPEDLQAYDKRAVVHARLGEYQMALYDFARAIELSPEEDARLYNNLASLLATCPDERCRDARRALSNARRACELSDWKDFNTLATLAAAHAEADQFTEAIKRQAEAIELAPPRVKEHFRLRLNLYSAGKPFRHR